MLYFSFFLHHYEPQLNKRIKSFLGVENREGYNTDRFLDIKLDCREMMLQKLTDYDPSKGTEFATYIYPFIHDAILRFRMGEFSKKYNCVLALAEEYLKVVRGIRNQQSFYITDEYGEETGEEVAIDDSWNYADILWNGIQESTSPSGRTFDCR